ncbi:MAG: hypothetical protein HPY55_02685 [Firmicutes bacterium]|nr:hypothetical protein [Bacillota bacterium]
MRGVTVRRALEIGGLARARLAAGEAGLDRVIRYVDIMEVPDAAGWFRPDELVITCAYAIREDPEAQIDLVRNLSRSGASGLAVKPSRFLGSMPQGMIGASNEEGLPLIELPGDLPYIEITHPLLSEILNEQVRELQYETDVHRKLTRLILEEKGLDSITAALSEVLNAGVYILDDGMRVLARSDVRSARQRPPAAPDQSPADSIPAALREAVARVLKGDPREQGISRCDQGVTVVPIRSAGTLLAFVVVDTGEEGPLAPHELRATEQAATVSGLEIAKMNAVKETEARLRADFFGEAFRGGAEPSVIMAAKAKMLGIDVERPFFAIVARPDESGERPLPGDGGRQRVKGPGRYLVDVAREECRLHGARATVTEFEDSIVVICTCAPGVEGRSAVDLARRIVNSTRAVSSHERWFSAGISLVHTGVSSLATAHAEAKTALEFGKAVYGRGKVACYRDLAPYSLLENIDGQVLASYWESEVGRLAREDRKLLDTLRAFLECGGEIKKTSQVLFVHRNTLDYRLKRIASLLDCNVHDPEVQFRLRLAFLAGILSIKGR